MHGYYSLLYIILIISNFAPFFSHSSSSAKPMPSLSASSSDAHTPTDKIKNQPQNKPQTPQNQTHPHMDTPTETERVDRHLWQIGVLGSEFQISAMLRLECSYVNNFFFFFIVSDWHLWWLIGWTHSVRPWWSRLGGIQV